MKILICFILTWTLFAVAKARTISLGKSIIYQLSKLQFQIFNRISFETFFVVEKLAGCFDRRGPIVVELNENNSNSKFWKCNNCSVQQKTAWCGQQTHAGVTLDFQIWSWSCFYLISSTQGLALVIETIS